MRTRNFMVALLAIFTFTVMASCEKEADNPGSVLALAGSEKATLEVWVAVENMTYQALELDIRGVQYSDESGEWHTLAVISPGITTYTTSPDKSARLIIRSEVDPGLIARLRLITGGGNYLSVGTTRFPLRVSGEYAWGLLTEVNADARAGKVLQLRLAIDVAGSISHGGGAEYHFDPVWRLASRQGTAKISGSVFPKEALPVAVLFNESDTLRTRPWPDGTFRFQGLEEGVWHLLLHPVASGYNEILIRNLHLSKGEKLALDPVYLGTPGLAGFSADERP